MVNCLKAETIDLIVTSPPYNLHRLYEKYNDALDFYSYRDLLFQAFHGMYRVLKPAGRLAINVGQMNIDGRYPLAELVCTTLNERFKYRDTIIWDKGTTSRRTAWGSWMSASNPYFVPQHEYIYVFSKTAMGRERGESDITRDEFVSWSNPIWRFKPETRKTIISVHPAPFPLELPFRLIKYLSYVGDTVLDPFMGSGTTMVAANFLERKGIGIDVDDNYWGFADYRMTDVRYIASDNEELARLAVSTQKPREEH